LTSQFERQIDDELKIVDEKRKSCQAAQAGWPDVESN